MHLIIIYTVLIRFNMQVFFLSLEFQALSNKTFKSIVWLFK